jgi:hypothetical protein
MIEGLIKIRTEIFGRGKKKDGKWKMENVPQSGMRLWRRRWKAANVERGKCCRCRKYSVRKNRNRFIHHLILFGHPSFYPFI